jgi:hypothetical protein
MAKLPERNVHIITFILMNRIIQDIFGPWSNENKVVLHKVFSNKFDVLPIGKQINLMHVWMGW